ncbi:MAG: glycosyltransferase family protein [Hyphomicrobiales bacterium]
MGRILYGVMGDRGGHLSRAIAVAHELPGHEILFVGGGRIGEVERHGFSFQRTPMIGTEMTGGRIDLAATITGAIRELWRYRQTIEHLKGLIDEYDPDLIVTDFEFFLPRAARALGRPAISLDRHHAITHCQYDRPPGHFGTRALSLGILHSMQMAADRYMVVSFAPMEPRDPIAAEVYPPVIRRDLSGFSPAEDEHAVVYLYGVTIERIREVFGGRERRFVVYGQGREGEEGNLVFRRHSTDGFLADLASAAYVVSHGGHNLISEALHFRKPLLAFPLGFEYEQYFNAWQLQQTGYGALGEARQARAALDRFEVDLEGLRQRLAGYRPWSERTVADRFDELVRVGL